MKIINAFELMYHVGAIILAFAGHIDIAILFILMAICQKIKN